MLNHRSVDIVVPVYNNAPTLRALTERCHSSVQSLRYACRMVFVNDASKDTSSEVLFEIQAEWPETCIVTLPENVGQQNAIRRGLSEVTGFAVVMDADLQDPPEAIPAMIKQFEQGSLDAVFGTKTGNYQSSGRMLASRFYRRVLRTFVPVPRGAGSFVAMTAPVAQTMAAYSGPNFYLVGLIGCGSYQIGDVPVKRDARGDNSPSQYTFLSRISLAMRNLKTVLWERLRHVRH